MAINTQFHTQGNVLIATSSGFDEGLNEAIHYNDLVLKQAISNDCAKVVCDERTLEYRLSLIDTYTLGKHMAERIHFIRHIAIVSDKRHDEIVMFWENVTTNRGVSAKVFFKVEDALSWMGSLK